MAISRKKHITATSFLTHKKTVQQGRFLKRCGQLLLDGFSLQEALVFLETIVDSQARTMVETIHAEVSQGELFSTALKKAGFSDVICAQLYFSLFHGQLAQTAVKAGSQLLKQAEKKRKLLGILQYPFVLLVFVMAMLLAMRYILLPHISELTALQPTELDMGTRLVVWFVYHAPELLAGTGLFLSVVILLLITKGKRLSPLKRLQWMTQWTRSSLFTLYWSQFFANEWGVLLKGNASLLEVVTIMKKNTLSPLITEMGDYIEREMKQGKSFHESLKDLTFLKKEITLVVRQGEQSGHLGKELEMYARECEEELDKQIEQVMNWVQPVIFIFVALVIVAIYAALLLPTFNALQTF